MTRETCHTFEVANYNKLTTREQRKDHLEAFELNTINDLANLISLCSLCRIQFDNYSISIDPFRKSLIVSTRIRKLHTQGGIEFERLHGKIIKFNGPERYRPTVRLLQYRHDFFESKEDKWSANGKSRGKTKGSASASGKQLFCLHCIACFTKKAELDAHCLTTRTDLDAMSLLRHYLVRRVISRMEFS